MNKELKEMFKKLLKDLDKMEEFNIEDKLSEAFKEPVKISIEKFEDGKSCIEYEGTNLSILITLAGLENAILKELKAPKGVWELVKLKTAIKDGGDNE